MTNEAYRIAQEQIAAEETDRLRERLWRRPSENAAERLTSTAYRITQAQLAADKATKQ